MAVDIKTIITDIKTVILPVVTDIKTFIFDDLSQIDANTDKIFKVLLMKPMTSEFDNRNLEHQFYNMDMFMFDLEDQNKTLEEQWSECQALLILFLKELFALKVSSQGYKYMLVDKVTIDHGHFQHNNKLVGVRARFQIKVFYGC